MENSPTTTRKKISAKSARLQRERAPKVVENTKNAIFLRGNKTSETCGSALKELFLLRKPHAKMMQRKNDNIHPFEDVASLEFLCQKNDCSLFAVACHSKKRPDNLIIGRLFDNHVLDIVEFGVESVTTIQILAKQYPAAQFKRLGSKPCVIFIGDLWDIREDHRNLRSLLLDFVRGEDVTGVNLASLDHVIVFTAALEKIFMRTYTILLKKKGDSTDINRSNAPRSRLVLSAPSMNFVIRRSRWPGNDLWKKAIRQPKAIKPKKRKNVSTSALGETLGQIHMTRQDYSEMQTRKVKALHQHKAVAMKRSSRSEEVGGSIGNVSDDTTGGHSADNSSSGVSIAKKEGESKRARRS